MTLDIVKEILQKERESSYYCQNLLAHRESSHYCEDLLTERKRAVTIVKTSYSWGDSAVIHLVTHAERERAVIIVYMFYLRAERACAGCFLDQFSPETVYCE